MSLWLLLRYISIREWLYYWLLHVRGNPNLPVSFDNINTWRAWKHGCKIILLLRTEMGGWQIIWVLVRTTESSYWCFTSSYMQLFRMFVSSFCLHVLQWFLCGRLTVTTQSLTTKCERVTTCRKRRGKLSTPSQTAAVFVGGRPMKDRVTRVVNHKGNFRSLGANFYTFANLSGRWSQSLWFVDDCITLNYK